MARRSKPDTRQAMRQLLTEIRRAIPTDTPLERLCAGPCSGCPKKLLEFLDRELSDWDSRLDRGDRPALGELSKLARSARKIQRVLVINGVLPAPEPGAASPPDPHA